MSESPIVLEARRINDGFSADQLVRGIEETRAILEMLVTDHGRAHGAILVAIMRASLKRKGMAARKLAATLPYALPSKPL